MAEDAQWVWLFWLATVVAVATGPLALIRKRTLASWLFLIGLLLLGAEMVFSGLAAAEGKEDVGDTLGWLAWAFVVRSMLPFVWLVFSLVYCRGNWREFVSGWWPVLALSVAVPVWVFAFVGYRQLFVLTVLEGSENEVLVTYGRSAQVLWLVLLAAALLILVNLEKTFRTSVGTMRWRVKFFIVGLAAIFGMRIYTASQALLFSELNPGLGVLNAAALLVGCAVMAAGYARSGFSELDIYPSRAVLQSSVTVFVVGGYLAVVGIFAQVIAWLGGVGAYQAKAIVVLAGLVGLVFILLSEKFRHSVKQFAARNFSRPQHDFRRVWTAFNENVAPTLNEGSRDDLAAAVAKLVSETFEALSVTVLLPAENAAHLEVAASTFEGETGEAAGAAEAAKAAPLLVAEVRAAVDGAEGESGLQNLEKIDAPWAESLRALAPVQFERGGARYVVPFEKEGVFLGIAVLGDRVNGTLYTEEEKELIRCVSEQTSSALLNLSLRDDLFAARELEAAQQMSTFFVHDMKNAAHGLKMTVKNLPVFFDNPEFRAETVRGLENTANKIEGMVARFTSLKDKLVLRYAKIDFAKFMEETLDQVVVPGEIALKREISQVSDLALDPLHMQSVVTNLVYNACEAVMEKLGKEGQGAGRGTVAVKARPLAGGGAEIVVSDNGLGMEDSFIRDGLFRPFHSTKSKGLGIGMFQSKTIVEAHGGKILVESVPGEGTVFTVQIPGGAEPPI